MPHNRGWRKEEGNEIHHLLLELQDNFRSAEISYWDWIWARIPHCYTERVWGWDGDGRRQTRATFRFLPSSYCTVDLEHLLNPIAHAVTPMSPNYRRAMPKLNSLDYICINWINIQFQAIYYLLPQAKDFSFLPVFLISVLISVFWGFSWFCLFVCHQRLISTPTYPEAGGCTGSACACLQWYWPTQAILLLDWVGSDHCSLSHARARQPVVCLAS